MSQEAERRHAWGWRFQKKGDMAEFPDRVGEWVEGKLAGEFSGSMKSALMTFKWRTPIYMVLSFSPGSSAAWMHILRFNMVVGVAKGVQVFNPLPSILTCKKFWKLSCLFFYFVSVSLANFCGGDICPKAIINLLGFIPLSGDDSFIYCKNIYVLDFRLLSPSLLGHLYFVHCIIFLKS